MWEVRGFALHCLLDSELETLFVYTTLICEQVPTIRTFVQPCVCAPLPRLEAVPSCERVDRDGMGLSRYAVGWMIAERELAAPAQCLIEETIAGQRVDPNKLTIHADRGSWTTSKPVALLLADLGVTKLHSRPHVSNDN